ncbi:MAG TPA: bifunctional YncE family protein/alkaline phosphatase family protein [Candidatus Eremiobacteraceae bacterium]|jgi:YVTN family beta-propeller protein
MIRLMMRKSLAALFAASLTLVAADARAGILPNGWSIHPAGALTSLGTLPLHMAFDHAGRWLAVTNAGYAPPSVSIVEAASGRVVDTERVDGAFYGVAFSPDDSTLYVATAQSSGVKVFGFDKSSGKLVGRATWTLSKGDVWADGLAVSSDGSTVYVTGGMTKKLYALDSASGKIRWSTPTGTEPLAVVLSPNGERAYVSDWGAASIAVIDVRTGLRVAMIVVDHHPNALTFSPDGGTLYVSCANSGTVDVVDTKDNAVRTRFKPSLWADALEGTTPSGLAVTSDGKTLFVADAGDNAVTALSTESGKVTGAVPVGWYPTDVAISADGSTLFVLDGDGLSGHPNPTFGHSAIGKFDDSKYIGSLLTGDLERVPLQGSGSLDAGLATARADARYRGGDPPAPARSTSVRHVIYVIKENRTYDEILGDDPRGDGDASLALFGRKITPNIHRLADDFVLMDRFEESGFVSVNGHNWATAAYADDYVEKLWPTAYAGRGRENDSFFPDDPPAVPDAGYIWNDALSHGRTVRDYGEFVFGAGKNFAYQAKALSGHTDLLYRGWDLQYSDQSRIDEWAREFDAYDRDGGLPDLEIMYLPDDHTAATRPGYRTPFAMEASNDYAVGRLVDRLSRSRYWKDTVVFVVEDDSQSGPDHVSAQRAEALVVGGPVRRGVVSHDNFTQCSVLRTIEMVLGLPPMSQFDAGALPMTSLLAETPDTTPWKASKPSVSLSALNGSHASHAQTSMLFDFSKPDASDEAAFNAVLYDYAKATLRRSSRVAATPGR